MKWTEVAQTLSDLCLTDQSLLQATRFLMRMEKRALVTLDK